jgi:hypothetical protein
MSGPAFENVACPTDVPRVRLSPTMRAGLADRLVPVLREAVSMGLVELVLLQDLDLVAAP